MTDPPPVGCEIRGEGPVERVLYPVAVHFKGSGFYSTDYGRGSKKPTKEADGAAGGDSGGGDKAAEKKPAEAS